MATAVKCFSVYNFLYIRGLFVGVLWVGSGRLRAVVGLVGRGFLGGLDLVGVLWSWVLAGRGVGGLRLC